MMKLYRKNEVLFSVLLIVLYVVVSGSLRSNGDDSPAMTVWFLALSAGLALFVWRAGLAEKYGLVGWSKNSRQMLWFIPLWIVATGNLWGGIEPKYPMPGLAFAMVSFALVGFVEELLFRGFLFKAMLANGSTRVAIIVSAVTFGAGHIVNLLTGHAAFETIVQVVFAIAMGFIFTLVYYKGGSLWPCIIAHSMIDVFSTLSARNEIMDWIFLGSAFVIAVAYSTYLSRVETPAINTFAQE